MIDKRLDIPILTKGSLVVDAGPVPVKRRSPALCKMLGQSMSAASTNSQAKKIILGYKY